MQPERVYRVLAITGREDNIELWVNGPEFICKCDAVRPPQIDIEKSNIAVVGFDKGLRVPGLSETVNIRIRHTFAD